MSNEIDVMIDEVFHNVTKVEKPKKKSYWKPEQFNNKFYTEYLGNGSHTTFARPRPGTALKIKCKNCDTKHLIYQEQLNDIGYYDKRSYTVANFEFKRQMFFCSKCGISIFITGGNILEIKSNVNEKDK